MAYVDPNFQSKKAFKDALARGDKVYVFSNGPFPPKQNGKETISGPHFPKPHTWYATVNVVDGIVTKILS